MGSASSGPPRKYTPELAAEICERLSAGEPLYRICAEKRMPAESRVRAWALDDLNGFAAEYTRARELGYDCIAEQILRLSDESRLGTKTVEKQTGIETTTGDMVDRSRLQVDARKWLLSKMLPKRYGDRTTVAGDPDAPIHHKVSAATMSDDQLAAIALGHAAKP